jgi:hypothetical protein
MVTGLPFLLLLPLVVYQIAKRVHPSRTWRATGLSFGLIIAPASLGLYTLYFVSYLGFLPGMVGLLSSFVHDIPGFEISDIPDIVRRPILPPCAGVPPTS